MRAAGAVPEPGPRTFGMRLRKGAAAATVLNCATVETSPPGAAAKGDDEQAKQTRDKHFTYNRPSLPQKKKFQTLDQQQAADARTRYTTNIRSHHKNNIQNIGAIGAR